MNISKNKQPISNEINLKKERKYRVTSICNEELNYIRNLKKLDLKIR